MTTAPQPSTDIVGFQGPAGGGELATQAGSLAAVAREEAEIKAQIVVARANRRDEQAAYVRIMNSCKRAGFAEAGAYSFKRGKSQVRGPSINMARELARCWGNLRFGLRIVTDDEDRVHIKGYAHDLETNALVEMEDKFEKLIQRRNRDGSTRWIRPDERDLRELVNRRGAICVRNAILQLMPPDIVDEAMQRIEKTLQEAAAGNLQQDRQATIRSLVVAFDGMQVSIPMLDEYLGHSIDQITDAEFADLRMVYRSIKDGNSTREEHFPFRRAESPAPPVDEGRTETRTQAPATEQPPQRQTPPKAEQPAAGKENLAETMDAQVDAMFAGDQPTPPPETGKAQERHLQLVEAFESRAECGPVKAGKFVTDLLNTLGYQPDQLGDDGLWKIVQGQVSRINMQEVKDRVSRGEL